MKDQQCDMMIQQWEFMKTMLDRMSYVQLRQLQLEVNGDVLPPPPPPIAPPPEVLQQTGEM